MKAVSYEFDNKLRTWLEENGYLHLCIIEDQVCAIMPFLFTYAIVVNIDNVGYSYRCCYHNYAEALTALVDWIISDDPEPKNYIVRKG